MGDDESVDGDSNEILTEIAGFSQALDDVQERHQQRPAVGSQAAAEVAIEGTLAGPQFTLPVSDAISIARVLRLATGDHVIGIARLLDFAHPAPLTLWAHHTMARAALDIGSRVAMIADTSLDARARAALGANERLFAVYQGEIGGIEQRTDPSFRDDAYAWARQIGLTHKDPTKWGQWFVGDEWPPIGTRVKNLLGEDGEKMFRLHSAALHGNIGMLYAERPRALNAEGNGGTISFEPSVADIIDALGWAFTSWTLSAMELYTLLGWWEPHLTNEAARITGGLQRFKQWVAQDAPPSQPPSSAIWS